jgi:penicillin-binding protein 2
MSEVWTKDLLKDGEFDTASVAGKNLVSTIDLELQQYGEMLMAGKRGSVVAIEPKTGEVLAMISAPTYDPNLLTGALFGNNYMALNRDETKPLFNRPIMAMYPPGSIFKIVQSLVGLQMGVLTPNTTYSCNRSLVACHNHPNPYRLIWGNKKLLQSLLPSGIPGYDQQRSLFKYLQGH